MVNIDTEKLKDMLERTVNEWFVLEQNKVHICDGSEDGSVGVAIDELVDVCHTQMMTMIRLNMRSLELSPGKVALLREVLPDRPELTCIRNAIKELEVPDDI